MFLKYSNNTYEKASHIMEKFKIRSKLRKLMGL